MEKVIGVSFVAKEIHTHAMHLVLYRQMMNSSIYPIVTNISMSRMKTSNVDLALSEIYIYTAYRYQFRDLKVIYTETAMIHQEASDLLSFELIKFKMQSWQRNQNFPRVTSSTSFKSYLQEEICAKINEHNLGRSEIY
ncbi:hypothetical protein KQX54_013406 [Cotesia glomerata]|uniref:Uncharacterized protein n=1 Tax=Cotesia glomerata TaxID=32391 RepID=A0AAV7I8W6_COTGL|nr:hypothetical protein KQX54_013406 [Cotesia glomerata]